MLVATLKFNLENRRHERNINIKRVSKFLFFFLSRDMAVLTALEKNPKIKTDSCKIMQLELLYSE